MFRSVRRREPLLQHAGLPAGAEQPRRRRELRLPLLVHQDHPVLMRLQEPRPAGVHAVLLRAGKGTAILITCFPTEKCSFE